MPIDLSKLENVRERGGKVIARCPACAELGEDRKADNLAIFNSGAYRCIKDDNEQHSRRIHQIAGAEKSASLQWTPPPPSPNPTCKKPAKPLPTLSITTPERLRQIAISRDHTPDGMEVLVERGLLFTAEVYDDGKTWPAWIVTDPTRINAQARKFDRGVWTGIGGKKAKSLPDTTAARCIGASIIGDRPEVWLMEGTPDLIAAPVLAKLSGRNLEQIAFCCITGTGNPLHADDLPHFTGKRIVIAVHNDTDHGKGAKAAQRWANQLWDAGAVEITGFDFARHRCKDLSDYVAVFAPHVPSPTNGGVCPVNTKGTAPEGLCPACWSRRIAVSIGSPWCACKPYRWPTWTPEQIAADTWADGRE